MSKKIALITPDFHPNKSGIATVSYIHYLAIKEKFQIKIFSNFKDENSEFINIDLSNNLFTPYKKQFSKKLVDQLNKYNPDIIFVQCLLSWTSQVISSLRSELINKNIKFVLFSHGVSHNEIIGNGLLSYVRHLYYYFHIKFILPKIISNFDLVISIGEFKDSKCFIEEKISKIKSIQYSTIENGGVDYSDLSIEKSKRFTFLCVANYNDIKNQKFLIQLIKKNKNIDADFIFLGSEKNTYYHECEEIARNDKRIFLFIESSSNTLKKYYSLSHAFIYSSRWEAQSLVLLDAQASGLPLIISRTGSYSKLPGAIICNSKTEYINAINQLIKDNYLLNNLKSKGLERYVKINNWNNSTSVLLEKLSHFYNK